DGPPAPKEGAELNNGRMAEHATQASRHILLNLMRNNRKRKGGAPPIPLSMREQEPRQLNLFAGFSFEFRLTDPSERSVFLVGSPLRLEDFPDPHSLSLRRPRCGFLGE